MKFICSIILVFLLIQSVKGQELYGRYLNHEQGLLSKECYDINYDEKGYLIVSTMYGPMKYNGEKFLPICTNLSIDRRIMYDFEKDSRGNVYMVNSRNELFKLQNDKAIWIGPENRSQFLQSRLAFLKLYSYGDCLYIGTYIDFLKYSFKTRKATHFYSPKANWSGFIYDSKAPFPFIKKIGGDNVRFEFPESGQRFEFKENMMRDSREGVLTVGKTTYLLISTKLFKKVNNHVTPMNFNRILYFEYFHNRLWLCTMDGLIELDANGNFIHHHFKGEIIGGAVPLKSGGIAVSLNRKGIFISSNINNRIHSNISPTSSAAINGMNLIGDSKGNLYKYAGYRLEKITQIPPVNTITKRPYQDDIVDISSYKNSILLTCGFGISAYSQDFKKVKNFQDPKNDTREIILCPEKLYHIVKHGIMRVNWKDLDKYPAIYKFIPLSNIGCHARLNDSTVLFGTNSSLFRYNLNTDSFSRSAIFKKDVRISKIHVIGKNKLLICTRFKGAYMIQNNKIIRKIQMPCTSVSGSIVYNKQLIIRGNDGIYIKSLDQSDQAPWYKTFSGETQNMFILEKKLLIAYQEDLIIKKLTDQELNFKPGIVLNRFQLGDTDINRFPSIIPPDKSFSIDVDILQFDANKMDLYYILRGENTISQHIEGTKINFDALKSGSYSLQIYPVIDGKIQFNNSKTFRFTIEKTFWESTVFYILAIILLTSIIISSLLLINLRRRKRSAQRSELENKLNEYKLLAVKAQVNPHFLSNGLAAIQALILKGNNDLAAQYLAKFSFLMRKILYYSETQFISVKQELQLVDAYLELELLRFRHRFMIRREIKLSESQLEKFQFPSLLLQPILENAIWHGLKFQENNPELHIRVEIDQNNNLLVRISDNGLGFNESTKNEEHLSKGNQLINDRIDTLNMQFQKNVASMEVISSPSGTSITFIFHPEVYQSVKP